MPPRQSSAGREAVDLAADAGLHLDPWEADVLEDALGERRDGTWAASQVGLVVPRQNGKGAILTARELAGLFLFDERLLIHTAHEFKTAQEAFLRLLPLIEGNRALRRRVRRISTAHGKEGVELRSGARLRFLARSRGSGRGFSGDVILLDEAYELALGAVAALIPVMGTYPNPQLWLTSSAPLEDEGSKDLRKLCRRGRAGKSKRLCYIEFCGDAERYLNEPGYLDDREALAEANPGYPYRLLEENVQTEREMLEPQDFARERLGIWFDNEEETDQVLPAEDWEVCGRPKSKVDGPLTFALDVSPDYESAAFAVAADSTLGGKHVEVIEHRSGTKWVVERAAELKETYGCKLAIAKGSPAWSFQQQLESEGIELEVLTVAEHAQACGHLLTTVVDHELRHIVQPELNKAVAGADRRSSGDAWLWSRSASTVDICPLVAVTLALWKSTRPDTPPATAEAAPAGPAESIFRPKGRLRL